FAFVDGIDEVTKVFSDHSIHLDARHLLARDAVVWADGHSDYGHVFERFWDVTGLGALGSRTTVIITGDARNNYRDPGLAALRALHAFASSSRLALSMSQSPMPTRLTMCTTLPRAGWVAGLTSLCVSVPSMAMSRSRNHGMHAT